MKPACLQIHQHTSAPKFMSLLSQTLPSPLQCDLVEQTFCTTYCNMSKIFCSMIDTGEFYICPSNVFSFYENILILLSCIYLYSSVILLPEGNPFRICCQMSLGIIRKLCCYVLRICIFQGILFAYP